MIDLLEIDDFLDSVTLADLVAELDRSAGRPSTVLSADAEGALDTMARKSTRIAVAPEMRERVKARLMERKAALEQHFGIALTGCEDPQFLRYETGDFFVPHQDGNTPMVWDDSRFRRISAVVFLTPQSDDEAEGTYGGGALVFHGRWDRPDVRIAAGARPGSMVAFRSETTHEVTPVTHGVRYTIATWFR